MKPDHAPIESYFDRVAESFDSIYTGRKSPLSRQWDRLTRRNLGERFDFSMAALEPMRDRRILDAGCGSGRYCVAAAERGAAEVVGVDLSAEMLRIARDVAAKSAAGGRCTFVRCDVLDLPLDAPFDDAIAMGVFDYLTDPLPVIAHLRGLVRGKLVASFPSRWAFRVPFRAVWLRLRACPVRFYSRGDIERLLNDGGFEARVLRRSGPIYVVVAEPRRETGD